MKKPKLSLSEHKAFGRIICQVGRYSQTIKPTPLRDTAFNLREPINNLHAEMLEYFTKDYPNYVQKPDDPAVYPDSFDHKKLSLNDYKNCLPEYDVEVLIEGMKEIQFYLTQANPSSNALEAANPVLELLQKMNNY